MYTLISLCIHLYIVIHIYCIDILHTNNNIQHGSGQNMPTEVQKVVDSPSANGVAFCHSKRQNVLH